MLRIELLPDYIHDKNKIRNLGFVWIGIVAVAIFFLLALNTSAGKANDDAKADRAAKEALEATTVANNKKIADEKAARAITESKQKFVLGSMTYNDGWPEVFETIRDVKPSDNSIILDSMSVDNARHQTVSLTGFGQNETSIVRWWMSLRNNTALFDHVNFDLVPHSYAPVDQVSNTGGFGGGSGGFGSGGGRPGGMGSGGMPGGGGNKFDNLRGPMGGGSGGFGGGGRMGGAASGSNGPGELAGRQGINFTASVVLKTALAGGIPAPIWPSGGGAAAPGGFGGFGGGSGGGSGGGMPSMAGPASKPGGA